ncbi:MAG: rhomboid family intramembrane serine protease [Tumebacillaceae bacterium]
MRAFMFQAAQQLIVHDDFTILPYEAQQVDEDEVHPVILMRRKWNTLQIIRLQPADGIGLHDIERMMMGEVEQMRHVRRGNGVQNAYSLTLFIFSKWRSDENMRAIAQAAKQGGMTQSRGAAGLAVDLARGVTGPLPENSAVKDVSFDAVRELVERYPQDEYPDALLARSRTQWEALLEDLSVRWQERFEKALNPEKKASATLAILVITALIWIAAQQYPDQVVIPFMLIPEAVQTGEWWRLITAVFMHYEFTHIAFNMMSLYVFGRFVERIFGMGRFLLIYFLSGLSGSLMAFALHPNPSLGASGAIFGLFGALLAFGRYDRKTFSMTIGASIYGLLAVNIIFGFIMPRVGYWAHIGGLIGGFLLAMALGVPKHERKQPLLYGAGYVVFSVLMLLLGMGTFS